MVDAQEDPSAPFWGGFLAIVVCAGGFGLGISALQFLLAFLVPIISCAVLFFWAHAKGRPQFAKGIAIGFGISCLLFLAICGALIWSFTTGWE